METTVIKLGGALLAREEVLDKLWSSVAQLLHEQRVVVVHGGGMHTTEVAQSMGLKPRMVHGRRVTTGEDLRVVLWTMRGELNARLVARAAAWGVRAIGLSGADGGILRVSRRPPKKIDGETIDFGWVGDVESTDPMILQALLRQHVVPVVAPLGIDEAGRLYNVNADTVSCAFARALHADTYLLVTESGGVRRYAEAPDSHLSACSPALFERGIEQGWITNGMRVKLRACLDALEAGVPKVFVVAPEGLLDPSSGTRITRGADE